jgi:hypothetical protein
LASSNTGYCFLTMFSWYPVMDLARAPRRAARKKGSGYENESINGSGSQTRPLHCYTQRYVKDSGLYSGVIFLKESFEVNLRDKCGRKLFPCTLPACRAAFSRVPNRIWSRRLFERSSEVPKVPHQGEFEGVSL